VPAPPALSPPTQIHVSSLAACNAKSPPTCHSLSLWNVRAHPSDSALKGSPSPTEKVLSPVGSISLQPVSSSRTQFFIRGSWIRWVRKMFSEAYGTEVQQFTNHSSENLLAKGDSTHCFQQVLSFVQFQSNKSQIMYTMRTENVSVKTHSVFIGSPNPIQE
jgi:hypothetical protein